MTAGTGQRHTVVLLGEGGGGESGGPAGGSALLTPSARVAVAFTAPDAGIAPMTWGQFDMWRSMVGQNSWLPLGGRKRLAAGTRIEDVAEELRYLMTRFPSLRTRLRFGEGDRPVQELFGTGEIALEVFEADQGAGNDADTDAERTAALVEARYRAAAFDFAEHWPLRMAVVLDHGTPSHLVAIMGHLALDAAGAQVMLREVAKRRTGPSTAVQPLDQARWQNSPAGRKQNAAALRYWETLIRAVPPRRVGDLGPAHTPVRWCARFSSPALRRGVQVIAERVGADSSVVLLAVYALALNRVTGVNPVVTRPLVNNRFRPGLAEVVGTVVQGGIIALDVAGASADEAVRRAQRTVLTAYKYAYYDPEDMDAMIARVTAELPAGFEIRCFYNDRRGHQQETADTLGSGQVLDRSDFRWTDKTDEDRDENLFVHIDETATETVVTVCAHTGYFSPERIEALARGMEQIAVEATG